jgi:redox-sensitive bicupin YhaK (pirin superfamily)
MITRRPAEERGHFDHGWLDTYHTFSFAAYHDPAHMGFRDLRVINDDVVQPGRGFGTHGHQDMEIVTYVIEGALEHRDSTGTGSVLRPGDVQRMTAGRGIRHSEFNASREDRLRLLQIWILPAEPGLEPGYEERTFPAAERRNRLRALATPDGGDETLRIHQDVSVHAALLDGGATTDYAPAPGRHGWVQVARGAVAVNGTALAEGDGAAVSDETSLAFTAGPEGAEFLYFDLA